MPNFLTPEFNPATCVVNRKFQKHLETYYIGRGSLMGNPFTHLKGPTKAEFVVATLEDSLASYDGWFLKQAHLLKILVDLNGQSLGCYCKPKPCHGDILIKYLKAQCRMCIDMKTPAALIEWREPFRIAQLKEYVKLVEEEERSLQGIVPGLLQT